MRKSLWTTARSECGRDTGAEKQKLASEAYQAPGVETKL